MTDIVSYEYKMVQLPQTFVLKQDTGKEIAAYLEKLAAQHTAAGWEFYRIDTVGVAVSLGCIASLFGAQATMRNYNVVCFRKPIIASLLVA